MGKITWIFIFSISILLIGSLSLSINVSGETKSDTVTIAGGDTFRTTFNADSGELQWGVTVYGDYFSGEYESTNVYMEIYDNTEDEMVYGLLDVGTYEEYDTGTVDLDSSGEYEFSLENENDFSVEVYYHLEYEESPFSICCSGIIIGSILMAVIGVAFLMVRRNR